MPKELIKVLQNLKTLGVSGDCVFYRTKDNGEEPIREDVINDVFSKLAKIDPNDEYRDLEFGELHIIEKH